jgi:hypothetical protein
MESLTTSITSIAGALSSLITYRPIGSTSTGKADADQWIISQTHEAQVQAQASQANPTQIFRQLLGYRHLTERLTHARGLPGRPGQRLLWSRSRAGGTQPSAASPSRAHAAPNGKRRCRRIPAQPSRSRACARYDRFFFSPERNIAAPARIHTSFRAHAAAAGQSGHCSPRPPQPPRCRVVPPSYVPVAAIDPCPAGVQPRAVGRARADGRTCVVDTDGGDRTERTLETSSTTALPLREDFSLELDGALGSLPLLSLSDARRTQVGVPSEPRRRHQRAPPCFGGVRGECPGRRPVPLAVVRGFERRNRPRGRGRGRRSRAGHGVRLLSCLPVRRGTVMWGHTGTHTLIESTI